MNLIEILKTYERLLGIQGTSCSALDGAYTEEFIAFAKRNPEPNRVLTVLNFIAVMRSKRKNVLVKVPTMPVLREMTKTDFSPQAAYSQIIISELKDTATPILKAIRDSGVARLFKLQKSHVSMGTGGIQLIHNIELEPIRGILFNALRELSSMLKMQDIPIPLLDVYSKVSKNSASAAKVITPSVTHRISSGSTFNWLCLRKTPEFTIHLVRAKSNKLVLRITVKVKPITGGLVPINTVKSIVKKHWSHILKEF